MITYRDYSSWIREQFPFRVQKISVDAGFTCPNRDGAVGTGGCIFCDNRTFNPSYCNRRKTITQQIEEGKQFFGQKYPEMKYLAYFQAYSNTYDSLSELQRKYEEALAVADVVGLVIGTRPDCINEQKLDYFASLSRKCFVTIEYGIESCEDATLRRINRGHDFACTRHAIEETHKRGILTAGHVILGLPGEEKADILQGADIISTLPLDILKIHQMQIIRGTRLAEMYAEAPFHTFTLEEYIDLLTQYIMRLRKDIILERFVSQSPTHLVIAPKWKVKNHEFTDMLRKRLMAL